MHKLLNEGVEPLGITHTTSIGMKLILMFPGEFVMGSPVNEAGRGKDENQVEVRLTQSFWLAKYPVTQDEWHRIMGTRPWNGKNDVLYAPYCPATFVSWKDAIVFCQRLTEQEHQTGWLPEGWEYTLPTEAQWEYVCRAGTVREVIEELQQIQYEIGQPPQDTPADDPRKRIDRALT